MFLKKEIIVISRKYNDKESLRCFFDGIVFNNDDFLVLTSKSFRYIKNGKEKDKKYRIDFIIFKEKWFNAFIFYKNDKKQKFYFNIASPAKIGEKYITYIDLDIDLVISNDFEKMKILDLKEFEAHNKEYGYTDYFIKKSIEAVEHVKNLRENKKFLQLLELI